MKAFVEEIVTILVVVGIVVGITYGVGKGLSWLDKVQERGLEERKKELAECVSKTNDIDWCADMLIKY